MIIYKVTNNTNGMSYIGQTVRLLTVRKAEHLRAASNVTDVKHPMPVHLAINEFGSANFSWEILETCESKTHLNMRERFYIKLLNTEVPNGYNQTIGGAIDESMSAAVRLKISDSMVELHKDPAYQASMYPKLKGLVPPNKGVAMSDAQKTKVSAAKKAAYADPNYINPNIGQKRTGQALKNVQEGHKRRSMPKGDAWIAAHKDQYTPEVREKMRQKKIGKKPKNTKKIQCVETGQIFQGLTETAKALDINRQSVYLQLKGKLRAVGGKYTFKYVGDT